MKHHLAVKWGGTEVIDTGKNGGVISLTDEK